jgi:hypothetical protein
MNRRAYLGGVALILIVVVGVIAAGPPAQQKTAPQAVVVEDRIVAGGPKNLMEVRHLILKGSNEEIGRALAKVAAERFQVEPVPAPDRFRNRLQRRFIEKNYPILHERMRGVATAFGKKVDDDSLNFSGLHYLVDFRPGCSVVYYPPGLTATNTGIVSRNYDFSTGTLFGTKPAAGQLAATARPYIVEMYPDQGYASLALYSYDLLSGALDGINSEGLTVALLADDELMNKYPMEPAGTDAVGLGVLQVLRLLLDTCANVEEAKETLLLTKQYYEIVPVHYLIADRHGKSFVWEYSQAHNREYIIESPGKALITTNFSLHRHLEQKEPPSAKAAKDVCPRYCALAERLAAASGKLTLDYIKESHKQADQVRPSAQAAQAPTRTLWHALYVPQQRKVQISFYLRDEMDVDRPSQVRIIRSDYLEFALQDAKAK